MKALSDIKITATPFVFGAWLGGLLLDNYAFAISATIICSVLILTKQMKLI